MIDWNQATVDYAECYADKSRIKFIEKYLYTFDATKGKKMPFMLFPRQRVFLETLATNRNVVSIKPRQCGITTLTSAWATAQCAFAEHDAPETILCIGNKLDLAQQLITKIYEFLIQVPRWYWGEDYYSPDPKSEKNIKSIFVKNSKSELELFNGCRVVARSSGENAARGISAVSILILDEAAFIENGTAVYATAAATMSSNPNSKTVMVSTPNGKDMLYYNTYRLALAKENNFIAVQFRWYQDPRYNKNLKWYKKNKNTGEIDWVVEPTIDKEGNVKYDEKHWEELVQKGWTPISPWYEDMCKSFNNDKVKIAQELDVSFVGSSDNVIDPEYIEQQEKLNVREPLESMRDALVEDTWFWKEPVDGHRYIASCLPTGEKVLTNRGLVNVEEVRDDDLLITKEGEFTKIKNRKYREVEDEEVVEIKLNNILDNFKFTHNHPIFVSNNSKYHYYGRKKKGKWVKRWCEWEHDFSYENANTLHTGSWLKVPNFYKINGINDDELLEKYNFTEFSNPLCNHDFWWYCGMWIAEGCVRKKGGYIQTTHNSNEKEYHDRIRGIVNSIFNKNCSQIFRNSCNACDMVFYSLDLKNFLLKTFGKYASGKSIAEWVKFIPNEFKLQMVKGFFDGDGHYEKDGSIAATSISKKLINDIQDILTSCGIVSSVNKNKGRSGIEKDKFVKRQDSYKIKLSIQASNKFRALINEPIINDVPIERLHFYFSDDENYIFYRVKSVEVYQYTGKVYNFETESESHSFCCRNIATHNCDVSRGSSEDYTAIEIIDMDGRDENGMPIVEQVAEYYGKKLGDEVGELLYNYATLYNNAFVVIDCTNGLGDVPLFTLIHKGYKNLYYDDSGLKKYTVQQTSKPFVSNKLDVMPGFHMQGNRYPVLANFANMVRNNEFKIRSVRVINELNTWIFKGEAKRMDHMDGSHDDAITCLAMGLFVMIFSYKKMETAQNKDKAILNAYMTGGSIRTGVARSMDGKPITPKDGLPFYTNKKNIQYTDKNGNPINGNYMWLFSKLG